MNRTFVVLLLAVEVEVTDIMARGGRSQQSPTAVVLDDGVLIRGRLTDHHDLNVATRIVTRLIHTTITMQKEQRTLD
jgi:hypothetical protein